MLGKARVAHLAIAAVLGLSAGAWADGTYLKRGGGVVVPMKNGDVEMVWETVDMTVLRRPLLGGDSTVDVTVTYLFRNRSTKALSIAMGFPVGWDWAKGYNQASGPYDEKRSPIRAFSTTVDGAPTEVKLERAEEAHLTGVGEHGERVDLAEHFGFSEYQVWTVSFAPGAEHTVVNHYLHDAKAEVHDHGNLMVYVLKTGRAWRGPIGKATLRFNLGARGWVEERQVSEYMPTGKMEDGFHGFEKTLGRVVPRPDGTLEVVWELTNFKPTFDLLLAYDTSSDPRVEPYSKIHSLNLSTRTRAQLVEARETVLALYGVTPTDPALLKRLSAEPWYREDPTLTAEKVAKFDPLLPAIDARLLELAAGAVPDTDVADDEATAAWVAARVKAAQAGTPELVRVPVRVRAPGPGEGTEPVRFVGTKLSSGQSTTISLTWAHGVPEPRADAERVLVVEGSFTGDAGASSPGTASDAGPRPPAWAFVAQRQRDYRPAEDVVGRVVATAAQARCPQPVAIDEKPWLVTVDSFPLADAASPAKSAALVQALAAAGLKAQVFDSRCAPLLFCCYQVVVAGRYATQAEATVAMKAVHRKGFLSVAVRRGW